MEFQRVPNGDGELGEAAEPGVDLSAYVKGLIQRDLARISIGDWLEDVLEDPIDEAFDTAPAVEESRRERDTRIRESLGDTSC
ncbi:hypothetical protein [Glycomyces xiaoerkulensis]|uniref:hypothetical protein n=1 Tax=Glycomyces xiaoerkulensis TaxID=2038139 RepID=UPI000C264A3F|nr:hypothetical protein [Glycomyces xiaoerkulensis]